jgi:hypothetical protein
VAGLCYYALDTSWYAPIIVDGTTYYEEVEPPPSEGSSAPGPQYVEVLPSDATTVVIDGTEYYTAGGVYYQASEVDGRTVYMIVTPPGQ